MHTDEMYEGRRLGWARHVAAPARCVAIALLALLLPCGGVVGWAGPAAAPVPQVSPAWAVICQGPWGKGIYYLALGLSESRLLYQPARPGGLGYLPSPDGQWLLVWDTPRRGTEDGGYRTWWRLVSVARGGTVELGETEGYPWLLPYWQDADHLLLQGEVVLSEAEGSSAAYDVKEGRLSRPLAALRFVESQNDSPLRPSMDRTRLTAYAQQHYRRELAVLYHSLWAVPGAATHLWVYTGPSWPHIDEPTEYLLLRNLGLPSWPDMSVGLGAPYLRYTFYPRVAPAPDGTKAAVSVVRDGPYRVASGPDKGRERRARVACLDLYSLPATARFGTARTLRRADWSRGQVTPDRLVIPPPSLVNGWLQPMFVDPRWSGDGRYLVYGFRSGDGRSVAVMDVDSGKDVLSIADASNAFLVPVTP
jgi:hypothetical protein